MDPVEAPAEASLHGVLVDVSGIGVLLLGESGTGKSECALDLVTRGHRLVADDVVEIWREGPLGVIGRGPGPDQAPHGDPGVGDHQRPAPVRRRGRP